MAPASTDAAGKRRRSRVRDLIRLAAIVLLIAAVVKELRKPPAERQWNGKVAGFVPYDLRMPTFARAKERIWNPESEHLIGPRVFGVGWTLNAGRAVALVRQAFAERAERGAAGA